MDAGNGFRVSAEVTPHHLLLTDAAAEDYDPVHKVNPPLRPVADTEALRRALADGTVDCVATDHAPHAVGGQGLRVVRRAARHAGTADRAAGGGGDHGHHRPARLARRGAGVQRGPRADRRACPTRDGRWRWGSPRT